MAADPAYAQASVPISNGTAVLPAASFSGAFLKYAPPHNPFSPFASWDATLALEVDVVRKGSGALQFASTFETVGIESPGSRVSVAGTGYIVKLGYARAMGADAEWSLGVIHMSSHLTRDLDQRIDQAHRDGTFIPEVADPSEYNAPFLRYWRRFSAVRLEPELELAIEPVNVRVGGRRLDDVRPVFVASRLHVWRRRSASLAVQTRHEIGERPINQFELTLELRGTGQTPGRLQLFLNASPGRGAHVSPNMGAVRDGMAVGVRMRFRST